MERGFLISTVLLPVIAGLALYFFWEFRRHRAIRIYTGVMMAAVLLLTIYFSHWGQGVSVVLCGYGTDASITLAADGMAGLYAPLGAFLWLLAGMFLFWQMDGEESEVRFFSHDLVLLGLFMGAMYAGNLITFYIFFVAALLLLSSFILHRQTEKSLRQGKQYLWGCLGSAGLSLPGMVYLNQYGAGLEFAPGGSLDFSLTGSARPLILFAFLLTAAGFLMGAGTMIRFAAVSDISPAVSAFLAGIAVIGSFAGVFRTLFYVVGMDYLQGSADQYIWLALCLLCGTGTSVLACREQEVKKRLAWCAMSNLFCIFSGIGMMDEGSAVGVMYSAVGYAVSVTGLFLSAAAFLLSSGKNRLRELDGEGKAAPVFLGCFSVFGVLLPLGLFRIVAAAAKNGVAVFFWLTPILISVSGVLTAFSLLTVSRKAWGNGGNARKVKTSGAVKVAVLILTLAALLWFLLSLSGMGGIRGIAQEMFR